MTGREHAAEAERLSQVAGQLALEADGWMDADIGWKASLSTEERLQYRYADLASAQVAATRANVHATLALRAETERRTYADAVSHFAELLADARSDLATPTSTGDLMAWLDDAVKAMAGDGR